MGVTLQRGWSPPGVISLWTPLDKAKYPHPLEQIYAGASGYE
jgi:hypothetical protein